MAGRKAPTCHEELSPDHVQEACLCRPIFRIPQKGRDYAETRAYLDGPAPSLPRTFLRVVLLTAVDVAAVKVA